MANVPFEFGASPDADSSELSVRLISEHFDLDGGGNGGGEAGEGQSALMAFLSHKDDDDGAMAALVLSPKVAAKWRWFVTCAVHLRFADACGQQATPFHARQLFPMATPLALGSDGSHHAPGVAPLDPKAAAAETRGAKTSTAKDAAAAAGVGASLGSAAPAADTADNTAGNTAAAVAEVAPAAAAALGPRPGDRPKRRATVFGTVMGCYRAAVPEGFVTLSRCLGDGGDVSQELRVRKSDASHRPPPRKRPLPLAVGAAAVARSSALSRPRGPTCPAGLEGGLLGALQVAAAKRAQAAANRSAGARPGAAASPSERGGGGGGASAPDHNALVIEEHRQHVALVRQLRVQETTEYHFHRHRGLFQLLKHRYDPQSHAPVTNEFYKPAALLQRESLRFDANIQALLRVIWRVSARATGSSNDLLSL